MKKMLIAILCLVYIQSWGQQFKSGYTADIIADGLNPVAMTIDHHGRIWMIEKDGRVLIMNENEQLLPDPFVTIAVDDYNERGLLGITLHPDFDEHPYVYLYYTAPGLNRNRVSRFTANGDLAVPGSERILLELDTLRGSIHNAGAMVFDADGYLYVATGEGGFSPNSQDTTNLSGKILRIRDDGSIPQDNPFYQRYSGKNRSIFAMGLRNPFNMAIDPSSGKILVTDVGQGDFEEINILEAGANYGWPLVEGPGTNQNFPERYKDPFFYYSHDQGCAIVGLEVTGVNHKEQDPDLEGAILYADYCDGYIKYLPEGDRANPQIFASQIERPLQIIEHRQNGQLYLLTRAGLGGGSQKDNTLTKDGRLWKIFYSGNGIPSFISHPRNLTSPVAESAAFECLAIGSDTIIYDWYLDQMLVKSGAESKILLDENMAITGNHEIFVVATNKEGRDTSATAIWKVTEDLRPIASVVLCNTCNQFKAGDTLYFRGEVTDPEEGLLDSMSYVWQVDLHHDLHIHPIVQDLRSVSGGNIVIPVTGETDTNVWIVVRLSASDSSGLTGVAKAESFPRIGYLSIRSNIPGKVNIDGAYRSLPYDMPSMIGLNRTIEVPRQQVVGDYILLFSHWENGSLSPLRDIAVISENDPAITVFFDTIRRGNGSGLYAEYYNEAPSSFIAEPVLTRIEPSIDFDWGQASPQKNIINNDKFSARFRGFIQPLFSEPYTLYLASDDGSRLWINDSLVIDSWSNHPIRELSTTLPLIGGKKYRITVEYYEAGGGAEVQLRWASPNTIKQIVPSRQLYPMQFGHLYGRLWHDVNNDGLIYETEPFLRNIDVLLLNEANRLTDYTTTNSEGFFSFSDYEVGKYKILVIKPQAFASLDFGFGLNAQGMSGLIELQPFLPTERQYALTGLITSQYETEQEPFEAFPNPTNGWLSISCSETTTHDIFDMQGKKLERFVGKELDLSSYPPGIYIVRSLRNEDYIHTKVIKY